TLVVGTLGVEKLVAGEPPGVRMIALIGFALLVMKVIVVIEERAQGMKPLSFSAWLGFAGAWLGMKPRLFASAESGALPGAGTQMEPRVLRDDGACGLSSAGRPARARAGPDGGVRAVWSAARNGDHGACARGLRSSAPLLHDSRRARAGRARPIARRAPSDWL